MATGNSKAAKSARVKLQLRDKKGRWIEMGGGVKWYSPNLKKYMFGTAVDATPEGLAVVEVKNPNKDSKEKIFTVNIPPSQLEKVSAKASLVPNAQETIKPDAPNKATIEPPIDKNNILFKNMHKNGPFHDEPFGPDYEAIPFDPKGVNNLQKNDLVTYYGEGTQKKGHVIGTDSETGNPIIQPEVSSSWGFGGHGSKVPLKNIVNVYKSKASSPSDAGSDKENKADVSVPSPDKVEQDLPAQVPTKPKLSSEQLHAQALNKKAQTEKDAAEKDTAKEKAKKIEALMNAEVGTRLLSKDETTINLVKQDAGYWKEEGTGDNYTSTQVAEKFAGEKGVSMLKPAPKPVDPSQPNSAMTSEELKNTLSKEQIDALLDNKITSAYTVDQPGYSFPGYNMAEEEALQEYVGDSSFINQALRANNSDVGYQKQYIAGLDQILEKSPLSAPVTVWRGIRAKPSVFEAMQNEGFYMDKGFSSTSSYEKVARDWIKGYNAASTPVTLEIKLPAGFKAHKVDYSMGHANGFEISSYDEEEEVILPRNTAFKVVSMKQNANNSGYTATVEPVITAHNSIKGTTGGENTTGDTGDTGNTSGVGDKPENPSGKIYSGVGGDNNSDGGGSESGEGTSGPSSDSNSGTDDSGPITEEPKEIGKLYTDEHGLYMLGNVGDRIRKGSKVAYTKKGVTQEGKVIALYEGVKSARVEWPDGSNSIKKANTLKVVKETSETDTAPVEIDQEPVVETPEVSETILEPKTSEDFATPLDSYTQNEFDEDFPLAIEDIPIGSVLVLNSNADFRVKKIGPNDWRSSMAPEVSTSDASINIAMGLKNQGKPSYNIYMPKDAATLESAPTVDAPEAQELPEAEVTSTPETTVNTDNFKVAKNGDIPAGMFEISTKNGEPIAYTVNDLKAGDTVYPVGSQDKPYGTYDNYSNNNVFINAVHPAGIGTVIKNDPKKPYVHVEGSDGKPYFPAKKFVAVKQSPEIDKIISDASNEPEFKEAQVDVIEETAAPEELAEMETAASSGPIDVSSWLKIKESSGSNPGGEYSAPDGTHFFVKQSKSDLHAKNEVLASDIYQAAGINSLELGYSNVDGSGKLGTIAPMLTGSTDNFEEMLSNKEYRKEFQKGWAVDAWLGNWDVVGLYFDNALTDASGKAIRVDPGGALLFRAMGSPKHDAQFSNVVTEWNSMRTNPDNHQTYKAFNDMTDEQIKESVAIVASFSDKKIDELVDKHDFDQPTSEKLKERLKARRDDLIKRANALGGKQIEPPLAQWEIDLLNGTATDDDLINSMDQDEEDENYTDLPNGPVSVVQSPQVQEAIEALKKKLQSQGDSVYDDNEDSEFIFEDEETDQSDFEAPLASWEKELLESAEKEAKNISEFDLNSVKPGTLYQTNSGQDAFVGKYNTAIVYGASVDYFKKGEKKSGIVSNIMVNQQSAKVLWSDGSSSIIKATQLIGKGIPTQNTVTKSEPEQKTSDNLAPNDPKNITGLSDNKPKTYIIEDWTSTQGNAQDYPIGSVIGWPTDDNMPNEYAWKKTAHNEWTVIKDIGQPNPTFWSDSVMDQGQITHGTPYKIFVPMYDNSMSKIQEVEEEKEETTSSSTSMNWADQGGYAHHFPIGTELTNAQWTYKKLAANSWGLKKADGSIVGSYSDSEAEFLPKASVTVQLPESFEFLDPTTKSVKTYPIGTTINKGGSSTLTKTDEDTWISTGSELGFSDAEINNLTAFSWFVKPGNNEDSTKKAETKKKSSLFDEVEEVVAVFEKVYEMYTEAVGDENVSWDNFSEEFTEYLPEDEKNWVEINNQKFFVKPYYSSGSIFEVIIEDEFGQTHATVPANTQYGNFDTYYLNTKLDNAFTALELKLKIPQANSSEEKSEEIITWQNSTANAHELPIGSKIKGFTTTWEKIDKNTWQSDKNNKLGHSIIDALKSTGNWKLILPANASEKKIEESVTKPNLTTVTWHNNLPSASDFPIGTQISTGFDLGSITFEKKESNVWSPTKGLVEVKHTDKTMDELKGTTWKISAVPSAFEAKPEVIVPETDAAAEFLEFSTKFTDYFAELPDMLWIGAKGTSIEFEVQGKEFIFQPHPMSTSYAPYMQLLDDKGQTVFSENDFELSEKQPFNFEAATVFNAALAHNELFKEKVAPVVTQNPEYNLPEDATLGNITYDQFASVPVGTKIAYMANGKVYGTYKKNANHTWRFQESQKEKPSHKSETNADFKFFMENNKDAASNYKLIAPEVIQVPEENKLVQTEKPQFVFKHQTIESIEQLNNYPIDTIIKVESSSWANASKSQYYKKISEDSWEVYQKTASTVSVKNTVNTNYVQASLAGWSKTPVAISIPTGTDYTILGSGEHAYVGDVIYSPFGSALTLEKINKTALNLIDSHGNKVKIPAKKLHKDTDFGVKATQQNYSGNSTASKYDIDTASPVSSFVEAQQAEKAIQDQLINFAGASASEYDEKGLGLPISPDALKPKDFGLSVIPIEPTNTSSPLFGAPKPTMPESPDEYPSFEESVLDGLPKWDSTEWLKKVEERYLQNPNKKFANVQKSTQWGKIQEVLKGNEGYKSYLNQLLSNKYVDQELFDMAESAIQAQEKINKPLKKAHQENVAKEKAEYEAKKLTYLAEFNDKVKQYQADLEQWTKVNINATAIKKLPKLPELVNKPVTDGPADWSTSHPGTYPVQTIMDAMRDDNVLARFGLAAAVDSDKIEANSVVFNKIKDSHGVEKFEIKFKTTHAFGKLLNNKLKADVSINQTKGIYYPKKTNMSGLPDDQLAKLDGKPGSSFVNSGTRFEWFDNSTSGKFVFQHADQTGQNISVNHNSVQLLLDVNATPADFQIALENLGINAKPSTPGALRVAAENKLLTMFSGSSNWGDENLKGTARTNALDKIKKDYNITVDDVVVETDAWGRIRFVLTDAKVEEFMKTTKVQEFRHSVYAGEDLDVWESILSGSNPGLAANYFRGQHGIGELKSGTGMSPDKDMSIGSGNGIFVSAYGEKETSAPYYNTVAINRKAIMRRLDSWANMSDNYGKNDKGAPTPFKLMKTHSSFHEIIVRDGIPVSDFSWVTIGSSASKKKLIERLSNKGIYMINGIPLEQFILTNSETVPNTELVNLMGTGIPASNPV